MISLQGSNSTQAFSCAGDKLPNVLSFRSSAVGVPYVLAVTDEQGIIVLVSNRLSIDFEQLPAASYRVYALSFIGGLLAKPGMNAFTDRLGFMCHSISSNYISVQHFIPDGGRVRFSDGSEKRLVCNGSGFSKEWSLSNTSPIGNYRYFLTDTFNNVLVVLPGNSYNFDLVEGFSRVWGASLTGAVSIRPGQNIKTAVISTECFDLSENFLEVVPVTPEESTVQLKGIGTFARQCLNDPRNPDMTLQNTAPGAIPYVYVLADASDRFIRFITEPIIKSVNFAAGSYRIYGLSYLGSLTGTIGGDVKTTFLSDDCHKLSGNFIRLEIYDLSPDVISALPGNSTKVVLCTNIEGISQQIAFNFPRTVLSGVGYALVVLNEQKQVVYLDTVGKSIDFSVLPGTKFFVSGIAYEGRLLLKAGDDLATSSFAEGCFALSSNAVSIQKKQPDGGMVSFEGGGDRRELCFTPKINPGTFQVKTTGKGGENYLFLLTDGAKKILTISSTGIFDLLSFPGGSYRIYGLSYTGALSFPSGAFIDQTVFSDECADLSDNFVSITKTNLDGAMVRLQDGRSEALVCSNGQGSTDFAMTNTSSQVQQYAYLLTDSNNVVVRVYSEKLISLLPLENNTFRVWGLAYSGTLKTRTGDHVPTAIHSDGCYDLSQNFVVLQRRVTEGGALVTASGTSSWLGCIGAKDPLQVEASFSKAPLGNQSVFLLTDTRNSILRIQSGGQFALSGLSAGAYRIWHVAHSGKLIATVGQNAGTAMLSDECFDLSDNFIEITLENVDGGNVAIVGDTSTTRTICLGQASGFLSFQNTGKAAGATYRYVLTNALNQVILILIGSSIDVSVAPPGEYRVYGISYTGRLLLGSNVNILQALISDRCYAVSSNFITIKNERVRGGVIAFSDGGGQSRNVCPNNGTGPQRIGFQRGATQGPSYAYLITNSSGVIAGVANADGFDFSTLPDGTYRVWGLAYSGTLLAKSGYNPASGPLVDGCLSLSENALIVQKINPGGGMVTLENGEDTIYTCTQSPDPQFLRVSTEGLIGGQETYLLTDKSQKIIAVSAAGLFAFDSLPAGEYHIRALAYNGNLLASPGLRADSDVLAQSCYGLSINAVVVYHGPVMASNIAFQLLKPDPSGQICADERNAGDGILLSARTGNRGPFVFLVTDTLNKLLFIGREQGVPSGTDSLGVIREVRIALGQFPGGHVNIWGLAYTGALTAKTGDVVTSTMLSDDCFALTPDSARFFLAKADGGRVRGVGFGSDTIYVCSGDQIPDSIFFSNSSQGVAAQYRYLLTNSSNLIIAELSSEVQNFENIGFNELRIWGVSFTGTFISNRNKNLSVAVFSNSCYDISDNYLTIVRDRPAGGQVSTVDNLTSVYYCPGRDEEVLRLKTSSRSRSGYVYIATDKDNIVKRIFTNPNIEPDVLAVGNYRIHGLSYTGQLLVKPGDRVQPGARLASSCFELSTNFITLTRGGEVDGQRLTSLFGDAVFNVCPGDGVSDLVIIFPPVNTPPGSDYVMVITDDKNRIIFPEVRNPLVDFEGSAPGIYRIWGISYTGILLTQFNAILGSSPLSSDCYDVSENFITVISEVPVAGSISTADGKTDISVIAGDGKADKVAFSRTGASRNSPYVYLLTTTDNTIVQISRDTFDFESVPTGKYRVWGLSYSGFLLAAPGAIATSTPLSDNCFSLSVNFVNVEVQTKPQVGALVGGLSGNQPERVLVKSFRLGAAPNPTAGSLRVSFQLDGTQSVPVKIQLLSISGQVFRTLEISGIPGSNDVSMDLDGLKDGVYLLKVQSASQHEILRIVKVH